MRLTIPVMLAPMAGFTDLAFRLLARKYGCGLVFTEMVSANGLDRNNGRTIDYLRSDPEEKPLAVQLFGSDPEVLARASAKARSAGADIIDLNMGCPVRKVTKTGAGAALLKDPLAVERILKRVRREIDCPITVKMRAGWDSKHLTYLEIGEAAEQAGVDAVTLHPRTARQLFSGRADRLLIRKLKERVHIPVIGNGDVKTPDDVLDMFRETGCDGVMVGRAALGNPWFFEQVRARLNGRPERPILPEERREAILFHYGRLKERVGSRNALRKLRAHIVHYTRGLPHSSGFRRRINQVDREDRFFQEVQDYFERLEKETADESKVGQNSGVLHGCPPGSGHGLEIGEPCGKASVHVRTVDPQSPGA